MKTAFRLASLALLLAGACTAAAAPASPASQVDGRWDAVLIGKGPPIEFRLDISGSGPTLRGTFYDGFHANDATTSASFENETLILKAEHYLTTITAKLVDGQLTGDTVLQGPGYGLKFDFHARRHIDTAVGATTQAVPAIAGEWILPLNAPSSKGEHAFRFVVEQHGADAAASILRIDGDTGAYSGTYQDGKWLLSHFDGHRPGVIEITPQTDGTLRVVDHNEALIGALLGTERSGYGDEQRASALTPTYTAYRPELARSRGLPLPDDFVAHTTARDPNETFTFNFPDADGHLISNDDPRFKGKVVLAIVTGTWCPNCHDEAKYLVQPDKKYHRRGLAIVALDFEEPEQQEGLQRERAFVRQYGVKYTYLIAGAPSDMWAKIPQLTNLNTWPATIFVGRDGKIKAVHSGFASPASGAYHTDLQKEFSQRIEQLLAEKSPADSVTARAIRPNAHSAS